MPPEIPGQRKGKIARAPYAVRTRVNELLRDGAKYAAIITYLDSQEIRGVNDMNVTNWQQGGYQDWLKEQARLDGMSAKREFALRIVRENEGSNIHEAGLQLAASQIFELLDGIDVDEMKTQLANDPENFSKIVSALARISKEALGFEKFKQLVAEQKRKIEGALALAKNKGGLTPETLQTIEQAAAML